MLLPVKHACRIDAYACKLAHYAMRIAVLVHKEIVTKIESCANIAVLSILPVVDQDASTVSTQVLVVDWHFDDLVECTGRQVNPGLARSYFRTLQLEGGGR